MRRCGLSILALAAAIGCLAAPASALADCKLQTVGEFHVDLSRGVPLVDGEVNGLPAKILIDTGASYSMVVRADAASLGIVGVHGAGEMHAVGGESEVLAANVKSLKIANFAAHHLLLVEAGPPNQAPDASLILLGDDFLSLYDIEFDYADGVVRLFQPQGSSPQQNDYRNNPDSLASLAPTSPDDTRFVTVATLNGKSEPAVIDSGAAASVVDRSVAQGVGASLQSVDAPMQGLGPDARLTWVGQFTSFAYGDEKISNVRMLVANLLGDFQTDPHAMTGSRRARQTAERALYRAWHGLSARPSRVRGQQGTRRRVQLHRWAGIRRAPCARQATALKTAGLAVDLQEAVHQIQLFGHHVRRHEDVLVAHILDLHQLDHLSRGLGGSGEVTGLLRIDSGVVIAVIEQYRNLHIFGVRHWIETRDRGHLELTLPAIIRGWRQRSASGRPRRPRKWRIETDRWAGRWPPGPRSRRRSSRRWRRALGP